MAKTKTPFLSLGAHGSVGEAITAQKRGGSTLVREKPFPADPYSLPQAYQRWLYEDYAYLWTKQSAATRAEYRTGGSRFHLTGFQYWMKYNLKNLPDIIAMWHLDEKSGAIATDFSRNANHGTILGPSPSDGLIDGAQFFDGLNDIISVPYNASLDITTDFTIVCFARTLDNTLLNQRVINRNIFGDDQDGDYIMRFTNDDLFFYVRHAAVWANANFINIIQNDTWHALVAQKEGVNIRVYVDNVLGPNAGVTGVSTNTHPFYMGAMDTLDEPLEGNIDHIILRNRVLDSTEIARHSERRYPSQ